MLDALVSQTGPWRYRGRMGTVVGMCGRRWGLVRAFPENSGSLRKSSPYLELRAEPDWGLATVFLPLPGGVTVDVPASGTSSWSYPSLQGTPSWLATDPP